MTKFNSTEITRLLERPESNRATAEVPEGFFKTMERKILDMTVDATEPLPEEPKKPIINMPNLHKVGRPGMPKMEHAKVPTLRLTPSRIRKAGVAAVAILVLAIGALTIRGLASGDNTSDTAGSPTATLTPAEDTKAPTAQTDKPAAQATAPAAQADKPAAQPEAPTAQPEATERSLGHTNIYAIGSKTSDTEINDLDEIFEADVFLEDI